MSGQIPAEVHDRLVALVSDDLVGGLKAFLDEPRPNSPWWPLRSWLVDYSFERLRPGTGYYMEPLACRQWLAFWSIHSC
jgi:hypothetical protein